MRYYLGTDNPAWLWRPDMVGTPLFVSHHRLKDRRTPFPPARTTYAVDSGAYTELSRHGGWLTTPVAYVAALRRYWRELGPFDWAAQQDSMVTAPVLDAVAGVTGHWPTVAAQHNATVLNLLTLRDLAPELPIAPVLQGNTVGDYLAHADRFAVGGVDLSVEPVVGVGSIAARDPKFIERLCTALHHRGIHGLHGFGVKAGGLAVASHHMASADSMAWSFAGRHRDGSAHGHQSCAHCPTWALEWLGTTLGALGTPRQLGINLDLDTGLTGAYGLDMGAAADTKTIWFIVPCGAAKQDRPAPAADLYTGSGFRHFYGCATAEAVATEGNVRVLILSAAHGLVDPATVIAPYDMKMGDPGSTTEGAVAATAVLHGMREGDEVYTFLPNAYRRVLEPAVTALGIHPQNVYEAATRGIGDQRGVCSSLARLS